MPGSEKACVRAGDTSAGKLALARPPARASNARDGLWAIARRALPRARHDTSRPRPSHRRGRDVMIDGAATSWCNTVMQRDEMISISPRSYRQAAQRPNWRPTRGEAIQHARYASNPLAELAAWQRKRVLGGEDARSLSTATVVHRKIMSSHSWPSPHPIERRGGERLCRQECRTTLAALARQGP
jgi:hypothetical protein